VDLKPLFASIGLDRDYSGLDFDGLQVDLQGWGSSHPIFEQVISGVKPRLVIEVGTWKGASVIHMAGVAKQIGLPTQFICVDTWLGSNDTLWTDPELRKSLMLRNGYPSMFRQFIFNVRSQGCVEQIFPLPMTSTAAAHLLKKMRVVADAIYIDAGHEEEEVLADLNLYYELLRPGGAMFGDDYIPGWPGVVAAVNRFCVDKKLTLTASTGKWAIARPAVK
jgi:cephalosporin hydroxylase